MRLSVLEPVPRWPAASPALTMLPSMRTLRSLSRLHAFCSVSSMTRLWLNTSVRCPSALRRFSNAMMKTCTPEAAPANDDHKACGHAFSQMLVVKATRIRTDNTTRYNSNIATWSSCIALQLH